MHAHMNQTCTLPQVYRHGLCGRPTAHVAACFRVRPQAELHLPTHEVQGFLTQQCSCLLLHSSAG